LNRPHLDPLGAERQDHVGDTASGDAQTGPPRPHAGSGDWRGCGAHAGRSSRLSETFVGWGVGGRGVTRGQEPKRVAG